MPAEGAGFEPWMDLLSPEETERLVQCFAELGVRKVRITGGEPLIRRDIEDLIFRITHVPEIQEVAISTNGVFLKGKARALGSAGLNRMNISLDTLRAERFQLIAKQDRMKEVLEGVDEACEAGFDSIKLNTVLMKEINADEILDLVHYAVDRRIEIRFIELMTTNAAVPIDPIKNFMSTNEAQAIIREEFKLTSVDSYVSSPAQVFQIEGSQTRVGFISPISDLFCTRCNRVRLKANGALKTCLHGKEDLDLKKLLREDFSNEEIKAKILEVVYDRPEQHFLNKQEVKHQDFQMSHVGG